MNSNPTGYPAIQQHANPMLAGHAGYPVQSTGPSNQQQMAFYPNAMSAYTQARMAPQPHQAMQAPTHLTAQQQAQQQSQTFAAMHAGGTNMMGAPLVQHGSITHTSQSFSTSAPYSQVNVLSTTPTSQSPDATMMPTTTIQPSQSMSAFTTVGNPFPTLQRASQAQSQQPQKPQKPHPQSAPTQQHHQQQQQPPPPQSQPNQGSPATVNSAVQAQMAAREKARIAVLLELNSALLQELVNLQAAGKSGPMLQPPGSQQSSPIQDRQPGSPLLIDPNHANDLSKPKASVEYVECLKRLNTNLSYLANIAAPSKKPHTIPILTPPPNVPSLVEMYFRLSELFQGVSRGGPLSSQQQRATSGQGIIHSNGGAAPMPVANSIA